MRGVAWPDLRSPREARERLRLQRAAQAATSVRKSAMDTAVAQIGAAFDEASAVSAFKIRVERLLQLGPRHPAVRARFGVRAEMLSGRGLDAAIVGVERRWRDEHKAFAIASAFGAGTRLSLDILAELRLILRHMHFKRMHTECTAVLDALCGTAMPAAVE